VRILYLLSVWLHILAAVTWIGGMFFLVLVVVPWMRRGNREQGARILRETGERFRAVGWVAFAILLVTGTYNLWARGVRLGDLVNPAWLASPFGHAVVVKLALFAVVLVVSAIHDFRIGPRATVAVETGEPGAERLRRWASIMGRGNALVALALVAMGVILVRGWPW
jgi:putative copper resistance protein D